jgi:hypothetical protein
MGKETETPRQQNTGIFLVPGLVFLDVFYISEYIVRKMNAVLAQKI